MQYNNVTQHTQFASTLISINRKEDTFMNTKYICL